MRSTAKILLTLIALVGLAGILGVGIMVGSSSGIKRVGRGLIGGVESVIASRAESRQAEVAFPSQDESESEPTTVSPDYEDSPGSGYGGGENSTIDQVPVPDENTGWTHIPCLVGKPRTAVEKSFGDPQNTNENPTTPIWSYWKNGEELNVFFGAIEMDELLGQGRTFRYPMIVNGVSYNPQAAAVKIKEIIPLELANKPPDYRVVFHEKRRENPTNRYIVTWLDDGVLIVVKSRTTSSATSEERYYNRERGLHEWRYRINEEVLGLWSEGQVESYRQTGGGCYDPKYAKPNEITGHIHIGKRGDWEVYF